MAEAKNTRVRGKRSLVPDYPMPVWMQRCTYYLLEFIIALAGITLTTFLLDRALFVLARYAAGQSPSGATFEEMNLWLVAMGIIWLPVAVLFYKRSRFEELNRPEVATTKLRRFFLYLFMLAMLGAAASFAAATLYSLLRIALGVVEVGDTLLLQTLPALVATILHAYVFRTLMRRNSAWQIKQFASFFTTAGTLLIVALLLVSAVGARGALIDKKTSDDLKTIQQKVDQHYRSTRSLPSNLDELNLEQTLKRRAEKRGVTYERQSTYMYKLCAEFETESASNPDKPRPLIAPTRPDFETHPKGKHCFDVPGRTIYDATNESSPSPSTEFESLLPKQTPQDGSAY